jgi:hypothetical protein
MFFEEIVHIAITERFCLSTSCSNVDLGKHTLVFVPFIFTVFQVQMYMWMSN